VIPFKYHISLKEDIEIAILSATIAWELKISPIDLMGNAP
jgi:hypothetical protein